MKSILILMVLFVGVCATKERYGDGSVDLEANELTRKLWLEIQKRLKDYDDKSDGLDDSKSETLTQPQCQLEKEIQDGKIIRTKDSLDAGATFIDSPTVDSRGDCLNACCDDSSCNLAVYKSKGEDHSCYLFDCGTPNVCLLTDHPGFEVISLPKRQSENKEQAKHENALENLAANPETAAPTATPTSPEPVDQNKQPVPLFGECQTHKDCAGTWSSCSGGYCLCQDGYHAQDGVCRKDCNRFEFECANEGQPLSYPQCIAIYDKCDGILHCKDGSDERNCDNTLVDAKGVSVLGQQVVSGQAAPPAQPGYQQGAQATLQQAPQQPVKSSSQQVPQQVAQQVPQQVVQQIPNQLVSPQAYWQQLYDQQFLPHPVPVQPLRQQPEMPSTSYIDPQQYYGQNVIPQQQSVQPRPQQVVLQPQQIGPQPAIQEPIQQQVQQPVQQLAQQPVQQLAQQPIQQPVQQPVQQPIQQPVQNPALPVNQNSVPQSQQHIASEQAVPVMEGGSHSVGRKPGAQPAYKPAFEAQPPTRQRQPQNKQSANLIGQGRGIDRKTYNNVGTNSANGGQIHHSDAMINQAPPKQTATNVSNKGNIRVQNNDQQKAVQPSQQGDSRNRSQNGGNQNGGRNPQSQQRARERPKPVQIPDQEKFVYPDTQNYYNYFRGNNDRSPNAGSYYGSGRPGGYYREGGGIESSQPSYKDTAGYGARDNGYKSYNSRPWQQPDGNRAYHEDYDYNYDTADGTANGGRNGGGFDKNGDYTDYYSPPVDSGDSGQTQKSESAAHGHPNQEHQSTTIQKTVNKPLIKPTPEILRPVNSGEKLQQDNKPFHSVDKSSEKQTLVAKEDESSMSESDSRDKESNDKHEDKKVNLNEQDDSSTTKEKPSSVDKKANSDVDSNPQRPVVEIAGEHSAMVDEEEVEQDGDGAFPSNKGAVVALALGLAITALLLVFVGCRLRNVKRRLRRGRPLNSNEADYLVNGMYL